MTRVLRTAGGGAAAPAAAAAALFAASLAVFWPGIVEYDVLRQYEQIVAGRLDDWHPPALARLWEATLAWRHDLAPLLALQLALYWLAIGLIATALARRGRARAGWATLAVAALPPFLGWQGVVVKDTQFVGATLAAFGLIAFWRLRARAVPWGAGIAAGVLLAYAMLLRANAVFALAPLIAMLLPLRRMRHRVIAGVLILAAGLALSGPVNRHLLGATRPSGVQKTQPFYDLAGIAVRTGGDDGTGLSAQAARVMAARHCVSPLFWDSIGDDAHCGPVTRRLWAQPPATLYPRLAISAARHPLAYLSHRAAHWNMTERWIVPAHLPFADPPAWGEPNAVGLPTVGSAAMHRWQAIAAWLVETPLGWPIAWLALAAGLAWTAWRRPAAPARDLAAALLASAIALEASFVAVSIASDLRYHLWPMIATALAGVLLADRAVPRRAFVPLAVVVVTATLARLALPTPPQDYAALIGWWPGAIALQ